MKNANKHIMEIERWCSLWVYSTSTYPLRCFFSNHLHERMNWNSIAKTLWVRLTQKDRTDYSLFLSLLWEVLIRVRWWSSNVWNISKEWVIRQFLQEHLRLVWYNFNYLWWMGLDTGWWRRKKWCDLRRGLLAKEASMGMLW